MRGSILWILVALGLSAAAGQSAAQLPGGKIAFLSNGGNFSSFDLYIMDPDGGNMVKLAPVNKVSASGWLLYPLTWSPDGTHLAYQLERDIYTVDVEGKTPVNLTKADLSTTNKHPAWSPDGTRIAFASLHGKPSDIYVMNTDGSNPVNLMEKQPEATNSDDEAPAWSPDGTKIAFRSRRDGTYNIYVMNADGTNPIQLTYETTSDCGIVAWSPSGRQIAFDVALKKTPWYVDIDVLDLDGSNRVRVSEVAGVVEKFDNESPSWSPDGSKIVFMSNRRSHHFDIWMVNPDGTDPVRVSQGPASGDHQLFPAWSPLPRLVTPSAVRALSWGEVKVGDW